MPSQQEMGYLRTVIASHLQPIVNELTHPNNLAQMEEGGMYTRPIPGLPNCEIYVVSYGNRYLLGLEMANELGLNGRVYECMVAAWKGRRKIHVEPANIMARSHPSETHWQVRFFNLPISAATDTYPQLEVF